MFLRDGTGKRCAVAYSERKREKDGVESPVGLLSLQIPLKQGHF